MSDKFSLLASEYFCQLVAEHSAWLRNFDPQHLANFEKLLNGDCEAALAEAATRRFLESHSIAVSPAEDLSGKRSRPDFHCSASHEQFYVEVTCISIEKAIRETNLPFPNCPGARGYSSLNDAIWAACKGKAVQCANLDHPALVAVTTFHASASMLCFSKTHLSMLLTGTTMLSWNIDTLTFEQVGETYESTSLHSAAFLIPDRNSEIGYARSCISGLLLCGFGTLPGKVRGIAHPNPARPFNPQLLTGVPFGHVEIDRETKQLRTRWE